MRFIFYLGHPAHFHLFRNIVSELNKRDHEVKILIKKKDILENLLQHAGWKYENILPKGRKDNRFSIAFGLLIRDKQLLRIARVFKPDLLLGTSAEIGHIGRLLNIPSIVFNEDDFDAVPLFSYLSYPFASTILAPSPCKVGKWSYKAIHYEGYHELAYLHPIHFKQDKKRIKKLACNNGRYFILRFAKLTAHHDSRVGGISDEFGQRIIKQLEMSGRVFITSEREMAPQFEKYRTHLNPLDIHHALYYADLYIGDSQTMAAEAAVLGTPSIRFNDFVGKLGYLEELEHQYGLTYGIKTSEPEKLFQKIDELLAVPNLKEEWQARRRKMLADKIDVTAFMVWFIENYPESVSIMRENPEYQYNFR